MSRGEMCINYLWSLELQITCKDIGNWFQGSEGTVEILRWPESWSRFQWVAKSIFIYKYSFTTCARRTEYIQKVNLRLADTHSDILLLYELVSGWCCWRDTRRLYPQDNWYVSLERYKSFMPLKHLACANGDIQGLSIPQTLSMCHCRDTRPLYPQKMTCATGEIQGFCNPKHLTSACRDTSPLYPQDTWHMTL